MVFISKYILVVIGSYMHYPEDNACTYHGCDTRYPQCDFQYWVFSFTMAIKKISK